MKSRYVLPVTLAGFGLFAVGACTDDQRAAELELQRRQLELMERAQAIQQAQIRAEQENQRREQLVSRYSGAAGQQIVDAVGGGQDLIVRFRDWRLDPTSNRFTIQMSVWFSGSIFRSNKYYVSGVLSVNEDGSSPHFARSEANQNYVDAEARVITLGLVAGGLILLNNLASDTTR